MHAGTSTTKRCLALIVALIVQVHPDLRSRGRHPQRRGVHRVRDPGRLQDSGHREGVRRPVHGGAELHRAGPVERGSGHGPVGSRRASTGPTTRSSPR